MPNFRLSAIKRPLLIHKLMIAAMTGLVPFALTGTSHAQGIAPLLTHPRIWVVPAPPPPSNAASMRARREERFRQLREWSAHDATHQTIHDDNPWSSSGAIRPVRSPRPVPTDSADITAEFRESGGIRAEYVTSGRPLAAAK